MWLTPDGERTLQGAEATLFREGLGTLVDRVGDDTEGFWHCGIEPFDNLHGNQKLAVLAQVGRALLRESEPIPKLTVVTEAAVGAVFESIRVMVDVEIDQPAEWGLSSTWREMLLTACQERGIEELVDLTCEDLDEWEVLIDSLMGAIHTDELPGKGSPISQSIVDSSGQALEIRIESTSNDAGVFLLTAMQADEMLPIECQ